MGMPLDIKKKKKKPNVNPDKKGRAKGKQESMQVRLALTDVSSMLSCLNLTELVIMNPSKVLRK